MSDEEMLIINFGRSAALASVFALGFLLLFHVFGVEIGAEWCLLAGTISYFVVWFVGFCIRGK